VEVKAPFPWFGGKSRAAHLIWPRFGNVPNYVEPFAGSLAVLLARPHESKNEIVNDKDCYLANAWRAIKNDPDAVADHTDWPVNEADLHARHLWLHAQAEFRKRMASDPDFYDARVAGYWVWGLSCWIGDNFCRPREQNAAPHLTGGQGVARQVPHLTGGQGVARKVPHLTGGQGVARKVPHLTGGKEQIVSVDAPPSPPPDGRSRGGSQSAALTEWFRALSDRLRFTKVCCGDWMRVMSPCCTFGQGVTGVLLDPPYDAEKHDDVYGEMSRGVSGAVREWALAAGDNPLLRIALCGYEGEHAMPDSWECVAWKAGGGYGNQSGNQNAKRERIWFSPACIRPDKVHVQGGLAI
jgi:site-specific DNA-adenine methylase